MASPGAPGDREGSPRDWPKHMEYRIDQAPSYRGYVNGWNECLSDCERALRAASRSADAPPWCQMCGRTVTGVYCDECHKALADAPAPQEPDTMSADEWGRTRLPLETHRVGAPLPPPSGEPTDDYSCLYCELSENGDLIKRCDHCEDETTAWRKGYAAALRGAPPSTEPLSESNVYHALTPEAKRRTSVENVADVLAALARLEGA
jgi:hypothetical protein